MRTTIQALQGSQIRQVVNASLGRSDVLKFWFGESDQDTPEAVRAAAAASMMAGETFYNQNLGIPELREAISAYMSRLHGDIPVDRIAVTSAGVSGLMLAAQLLIDAGDSVVAVTPVWPNLTQQTIIMGAKLRTVALKPAHGEWGLDMAALLEAITAHTKVLIVNAPNNPTGWTLSQAEQLIILEHCRKTGTWIVADEVYERLYYAPTAKDCAPSFLDIAEP